MNQLKTAVLSHGQADSCTKCPTHNAQLHTRAQKLVVDVCMNVMAFCAADVGANWQQPTQPCPAVVLTQGSHLYELREPVGIYSVTVLVNKGYLLNDTCQEVDGKTTCPPQVLLPLSCIKAPSCYIENLTACLS